MTTHLTSYSPIHCGDAPHCPTAAESPTYHRGKPIGGSHGDGNKSLPTSILFYCDTVFGYGGVQRVLAVVSQSLSQRFRVTILTTDTPTPPDIYGYRATSVELRHISYGRRNPMERTICRACSFAYKYLLPRNSLTARLYHHSFFPRSMKRKLAAAIGSDYDVVIGVHAYLSLQLAAIAPSLGSLTIGWMHNSYEAFFEKANPYLPRLKEFFAHEMRRLDRIVVLCRTDAEKYRQRLGLSPTVIYNPLTLKPHGKGSPAHKRFISVGRMEGAHKGFDLLVEAFARFAQGNGEWTLEIVGDGPDRPRLMELISLHGMEGRIVLSPFTSDIQSHYARASVYVQASRWEGFGLVLVEAMAHGLSIVASDLPVTLELLQGKGVATFFRSGDAADLSAKLRATAANEELQAMSDKACSYVSSFHISEIMGQWETLLRSAPR